MIAIFPTKMNSTSAPDLIGPQPNTYEPAATFVLRVRRVRIRLGPSPLASAGHHPLARAGNAAEPHSQQDLEQRLDSLAPPGLGHSHFRPVPSHVRAGLVEADNRRVGIGRERRGSIERLSSRR